MQYTVSEKCTHISFIKYHLDGLAVKEGNVKFGTERACNVKHMHFNIITLILISKLTRTFQSLKRAPDFILNYTQPQTFILKELTSTSNRLFTVKDHFKRTSLI